MFERKFVIQLKINHVSTDEQLADTLIKPLQKARFHLLLYKICASNGYTILQGHNKMLYIIQSFTLGDMRGNSFDPRESSCDPRKSFICRLK
ncbi:Uncharacterized protein TCM_012804 [Theobroma cacao]|uniref:Uncharacterized protein n=1 Tax=Theobroma cacao TaxID=3641 RepID=A0A061FW74_THECC|nr:Uncharacterized protein TCM_012804 [Theobroma cacao]